VVVIEHNLDVIKTADHLIDMGPEGGSRGGTVIATGTPETIAQSPGSYTGLFLKEILDGHDIPVGPAQPELLTSAVADAPRSQRTTKKAATKSTAKKSAAKKTTAKKTTAKKSTAKKTTAKKTAGGTRGAAGRRDSAA